MFSRLSLAIILSISSTYAVGGGGLLGSHQITPPAITGGSGGLPNFSYTTSSSSYGTATANCPSEAKLIGGFCNISKSSSGPSGFSFLGQRSGNVWVCTGAVVTSAVAFCAR